MIFKRLVIASTLMLATSVSFTATSWALTNEESVSTEEVQVIDENAAEIECVPQDQIDLMSDDDLQKLELPVCDEGEVMTEGETMVEENEIITAENQNINEEEAINEEEKASD